MAGLTSSSNENTNDLSTRYHYNDIRAIIIDNDATAALGVSVALGRLGVKVIAELSRIEDAAKYQAELVCCDLVLSREGVVLQGADGVWSLVRQGRNVLALSSVARPNEVGDVIGVGALGFIDRGNIDWDDFALAVGEVGMGQRHLSRSLISRLLTDLSQRPLPSALELDLKSQAQLEALLFRRDAVLGNYQTQELEALKRRVWSVWGKRTAAHHLDLTTRHLEILRRFHLGESASVIAKALNVSVRTIQADQDRIKSILYETYRKDLKREAACRLVWQLVDGQVVWGSSVG